MTSTISLRTPGADPRFAVARRGPYWRPGDSVLAEPWVALAETSAGHVAVRCGADRGRAVAMVQRWQALADAGLGMDASRTVVGAAVVDPHGAVMLSWGHAPTPGGAPRWAPLLRLLEPGSCQGCGEQRWPGCWVALDLSGCALCLPQREVGDPRPWPPDPPRPGEVARRARTGVRRKAAAVPVAVADGQGDLLAYRPASG